MISYRGTKCWYLGLKRWKVRMDDIDMTFDIICRSGIDQLLKTIDRWRNLDDLRRS